MSDLRTYQSKRDFLQTREPRGTVAKAHRNRFVVQRHDATRLHFDLRLELGGVYKSWAVTKVPSLDPSVKRLAVEVEDHPIDYGTFEGTIPKGQYGGGTVQLWDRGTWLPQGDDDPAAELAQGQLKFVAKGERMRGGWVLVRMRDRGTRPGKVVRHNWLLIKENDQDAKRGKAGDALATEVTSVKTGRTLDEIAKKSSKTWNSNRAGTRKGAAAKAKPKRRSPAKRTRRRTAR